MKNFIIGILLLLACNSILAQSANSQPLVIGKIMKMPSAILNEERILNIYLPYDYDSTKKYPVLYLLDGSINEDFLHITGLFQFFNLQFQMPQTIIVGIANIDRKRDFTYETNIPELKKEYPTVGHSAKFIQCIEKEIIPFIEKNFKTDSTKSLLGQSLGGLLASEILLTKAELFTHYFIISPSLWWDDESLLKKATTLYNNQPNTKRFVYIAVGKGEGKIMMNGASGLYQALRKANKSNSVLHLNIMKAENHATILHRSIYDGLLLLYPYKAP